MKFIEGYVNWSLLLMIFGIFPHGNGATSQAFVWAIPAIMALAGMARAKMQSDSAHQTENSDRELAANTSRYSPWTHMQPGQIRTAGSTGAAVLGGGLQGFAGGMGLAQGMGDGSSVAPTGNTSYSNYNTQNGQGMLGVNTNVMGGQGNVGGSYLGNDYNMSSGNSNPWGNQNSAPTLYNNSFGGRADNMYGQRNVARY